MKLGLNTFLFTSPFTQRQAGLLTQFAKWGARVAEIAVEDPAHIDPAKLKKSAQALGLELIVCACLGSGRDLRGNTAAQQRAKRYLRALVVQAAEMGATRIIGPLYSEVGRADYASPVQRRKDLVLVVGHLKELAALAETHGITLCLEPLNRFETDFVNTCEQGLALIERIGSPAVKLLLDTFHMNIEEKSLPDAIRRAGKHLGHVHACGSDRGTPGNDHTDWRGVAKALHDIEYKGAVVIESFTPAVKVIARAAAVWREFEPDRTAIARDGLTFLKRTLKTQ